MQRELVCQYFPALLQGKAARFALHFSCKWQLWHRTRRPNEYSLELTNIRMGMGDFS
jgi:hypothetical protein